jgi:hypothetical protein
MVSAAMSVVDCFLFSDELDMLECRLHELGEVVDWFVLVEGDRTFQGDPKPSVYDTNRGRFAKWSDRIVHVIAELPDGDAWSRERAQREAIFDGLQALPLEADDTIVLSDVDEIWRPSIRVSDLPRPFAVLSQTMYVHNLGWRHPDRWDGPVVTHVEDLPPTFDILRSCRLHERPPRVLDGGWHLSWFGGDDASRRKQFSFSHTEYRTVDMVARRENGLHIDGTVLERTTFEDVPRWIPAGWLP